MAASYASRPIGSSSARPRLRGDERGTEGRTDQPGAVSRRPCRRTCWPIRRRPPACWAGPTISAWAPGTAALLAQVRARAAPDRNDRPWPTVSPSVATWSGPASRSCRNVVSAHNFVRKDQSKTESQIFIDVTSNFIWQVRGLFSGVMFSSAARAGPVPSPAVLNERKTRRDRRGPHPRRRP